MVIAGTLTALLVVLLLIDAASASYHPSDITIGAILGTILTLLGIEAASLIRGTK